MSAAAQREARLLGLKTYHGTPCRRGHTERYTTGGSCVECKRIAAGLTGPRIIRKCHIKPRATA